MRRWPSSASLFRRRFSHAAAGKPPHSHSSSALVAHPAATTAVSPGTASHTQVSWRPRAITEVRLPSPFVTSLGDTLPEVRVRVESHGSPSLPASRTVLVFPSFSHSSHVASNLEDMSPGWWQELVGPAKAIDTRHWRVLCLSVLGSPFSPTQPSAVNPLTGKEYRAAFPQLTPTDLARCHAAVLDELGLTAPVHAAVGASLGGMQVLQFASLFPDRLARSVAIACTGRTTPFTVCIRRMQRRAILADPGYHGGNYADHPKGGPWEGLRQAREIGTLFYRSREEFDGRFKWEPTGDRHFTSLDTWEVESYLTYAGTKFVRAYDPNAYLLLSKAMDLMDLGDGFDGRATYAEGAARIKADTLLIGVKQDMLIPCSELASLADTINGAGGRATYIPMDSSFGHDSFLKEFEWLGKRILTHLEAGLEKHLADERQHNTGDNAP